MPRKLPWATRPIKQEEELKTASPRATKPKREQEETMPKQEEVSRNGTPRSIPSTPPTKQARYTGSRSPSSSPPPARPEIGLMREGYDADDAYMMVEDEFYTVAQSNTAHLHHAEYKRLMRKAQNATPKPLPELSSGMSSDVRQKLRRAQLEQKQKAALCGLGTTARSVVGEEDDLIDETRVDDPWSGTSLAGLMAEGSQTRTSLVGLERVPSTTRAARGYSKGQTAGRSPDVQQQKQRLNSTTTRTGSGYNHGYHARGQISLADAAEDDDDARFAKKRKTEPEDKPVRRPDQDKTTVKVAPSGTKAPQARRIKRSFIDDLEDDLSDPPIYEPPPSLPPRRPKSSASTSRLTKVKRESPDDQKKKKDRRSRLDEVPVFMIS